MSLLDQLKLKKQSLKSTVTVVTQIDGRRFLQSKETTTDLPNNEYGFIVDTKPDDIPAKILEHLYLGSQDCCHIDVLRKYNIQNVLSVGINAPVMYDGVNYKLVHCLDLPETKIGEVLNECNPFLESLIKNKLNVLVHCNAGVSRSPTVVIAYLMSVHGYSFLEAFGVVKAARSCIRPNPGFQDQLKKLRS